MFSDSSTLTSYKAILGLLGEHIEAVIAVGGTVITGAKTLSEYSHSRSSLISKRNEQIQRVGELAGCYGHLRALALEHEYKATLQEQLQQQIDECFSEIRDLNAKLEEGNKDPNWKLSNWKRFFLWYKPLGWRERVPHWLTYVCFAVVVWLGVRIAVNWADDGPSHLMFAFMLLAFTFVFHYWSLDGRRRELNYRGQPGRISGLLLVQAPENGRMLLGQIFFFIFATLTATLVIVVAADFHNLSREGNVGTAAFVLLIASLHTSLFHGWSVAESKCLKGGIKHSSGSFKALRYCLRHLNRHGWALTKSFLAYLTAVFFLFAGFGGVIAMIMEPRERHPFGVALASGLFVTGIMLIYASNRVIRIRYSVDQDIQTGEPLKGAVAAGD